MPTVEVLIGPIASGKSTYALTRARQGAIVVCHDDLTGGLHAEYRYEPGLREMYRAMEEDLARRALQYGRDVVVDRTHLTRESRARWVKFGRSFGGLAVVAVQFLSKSAAEHARRRFEADPRGRTYEEWLAVARHHAAQADAEPLDYCGEGFSGRVRPGDPRLPYGGGPGPPVAGCGGDACQGNDAPAAG